MTIDSSGNEHACTAAAGAPVANGNSSSSDEQTDKFQMLDQWHSQPRKIRIVHVGAGATGLCAAWKMERKLENYELVCYEKNEDIGGTWLESESGQCSTVFQPIQHADNHMFHLGS